MNINDFSPLVSIVIPVYNGERYLARAIDSALNQTYQNIEVIVVNDGSNDNTEKIAKTYGNKIRYFSKDNGGVSTALNYAIKKMNGEYFSWLSHDDVYFPNKIECEISILKNLANKDTVIYSNYITIDENDNKIETIKLEERHPINILDSSMDSYFSMVISGITLLIRKELLINYGLFDETKKTTQDYYMWFQILKDYDIKFTPAILTMTRIHSEQTSNSQSHLWEDEKKQLWEYCFENMNISKSIYKSKEEFYYNYIKLYHQQIGGYLVPFLCTQYFRQDVKNKKQKYEIKKIYKQYSISILKKIIKKIRKIIKFIKGLGA